MRSLADSQTSARISNWLCSYPHYSALLTVNDFLFIIFHETLFINSESLFDEVSIGKGAWAKQFKQFRDGGKLELFTPYMDDIVSSSKMTAMNFHNSKNNYGDFDDRNTLFYCDHNEIPVTYPVNHLITDHGNYIINKIAKERGFEEAGKLLLEAIERRNTDSILSSFAHALFDYSNFIQAQSIQRIDMEDVRKSLILRFDIKFEVPRILTKNSKDIIDSLKYEFEDHYESFEDDYKSKVSFEDFVYAQLPNENFVNLSPADVVEICRSFNSSEVDKAYQKVQNKINRLEDWPSFKESNEKQTRRFLKFNDVLVKVLDIGLPILTEIFDFPPDSPEIDASPIHYLINRRILNNSQWLLTIKNFHTDLNSLYK